MAVRSVKITLVNETKESLKLNGDKILHGMWTTKPPRKIEPFETVEWQSESNGILTGTEGWVEYSVSDGSGLAQFHWNNPYVGTNTYKHSAPTGYLTHDSGGSGHRTSVTFHFSTKD